MEQHDPVKVALVICFAAGLAASAVLFTIQREVNLELPKDKRFSCFQGGRDWGKQREIFRAHRRLYPDSELRKLYWLFSGLSVLSFGFIFLQSVNASR
jgi:hypothetical protein